MVDSKDSPICGALAAHAYMPGMGLAFCAIVVLSAFMLQGRLHLLDFAVKLSGQRPVGIM